MKLQQFMKRYGVLWVLIALYIFNRLPLIFFQQFAFTFDHGKDSLAVMDLVTSLSPKLIGPWTSIPGLYFGPGWYYLLSPMYWLLNFNPLAGPITMMLVGLLQLVLVYKYFGKLPTLILVATPLWFMTTSSAWNPYPLTLFSWLILIQLNQLKNSSNSKPSWLALGLSMGFGFHFSTAFALLYPILVGFGLWIRKVKLSMITILILIIGFLLPFIPQVIFEIRHNASEVIAVMNYLKGEIAIETRAKSSFFEVLFFTTREVKSAVFVSLTGTKLEDMFWLISFVAVIVLATKKYIKKTQSLIYLPLVEFIFWFSLCILWFSVSHFNSWYLLGLMPLAVVLFAKLSHYLPKMILGFWVILLLISPAISTLRVVFDREKFSSDRSFLPVKLKTIETVYQLAGDRPFASYQYAPHIYDFDWQYLYFWHAVGGDRLPSDFAYEPNVIPYIVEKPDLLKYFAKQTDVRKPEIIFYIVEKPQQPGLLVEWWKHQQFERITETFKMSDEVTLYVAEPKDVQ